MAKKKSNKTTAEKATRGTPMKECPDCHSKVHARKGKCDCGHVFRKARAKKKAVEITATAEATPTKKAPGKFKVATVLAAQKFIKEVGGIDAAKEIVNAVGQETGTPF